MVIVMVYLMRLFSPRTWKNSPERERETDLDRIDVYCICRNLVEFERIKEGDLIFSFTMFVTPDILNWSTSLSPRRANLELQNTLQSDHIIYPSITQWLWVQTTFTPNWHVMEPWWPKSMTGPKQASVKKCVHTMGCGDVQRNVGIQRNMGIQRAGRRINGGRHAYSHVSSLPLLSVYKGCPHKGTNPQEKV